MQTRVAVEAAVARLADFKHEPEEVGRMTLDELINFVNDCMMLVIKKRLDEPELLHKANRIMGGGIWAVANRRRKGPAEEWASFYEAFADTHQLQFTQN